MALPVDPGRIELLKLAYQCEREDERSTLLLFFTVLAGGFALAGGILLLTTANHPTSEWAFALFPIAPIALLSVVVQFIRLFYIRSWYIRTIETELRETALTPSGRVPVPAGYALGNNLTSERSGRFLQAVGAIGIFAFAAGSTALCLFEIDTSLLLWVTSFAYGVAILIMAGVTWNAVMHSNPLIKRAQGKSDAGIWPDLGQKPPSEAGSSTDADAKDPAFSW